MVTDAEIREVFRGFPAFSPDGRFIVGRVAGVRGLVMAAACNAHGVSGPADLAGHVLESLQPDPSPYVKSLSPTRYYPRTWDWESACVQAQMTYQNYYNLPPQHTVERTARGLLRPGQDDNDQPRHDQQRAHPGEYVGAFVQDEDARGQDSEIAEGVEWISDAQRYLGQRGQPGYR